MFLTLTMPSYRPIVPGRGVRVAGTMGVFRAASSGLALSCPTSTHRSPA
jgi:hypothetical protein